MRPQLPPSDLIPVLPQVRPKVRQVVPNTKLIHALHCPGLDLLGCWCVKPGDERMRIEVALHHVDNSVMVLKWAKGTLLSRLIFVWVKPIVSNHWWAQNTMC